MVGPGRAGLALGLALRRAGAVARLSYSGRRPAPPDHPLFRPPHPAGWAADLRPPHPSPDLLLLAVPDDALADVAAELARHDLPAGLPVLHASGSLGAEVLDPLARAGCAVGSLHPLVALATPESGAARLRGAFFAVEGDPAARAAAESLVRALDGHLLPVAAGGKARYHAAAVLASNFVVALLATAERWMAEAGVPTEQARPALASLAAGAVAEAGRLGPEAALTGPLARGDVETLQRHLQRLSPSERSLYSTLARETLDARAPARPAARDGGAPGGPTGDPAVRLYVNIDHVATLRQARRTDEPDPVRAAVLAELGGADGITVHLREDRRHVQERDVRLLLETVRTGVNLELAASDEIVDRAVEWRPMQATLVPERREEVTTEGGLAVGGSQPALERALARLRDAGIRTSLFIDPQPETIRASAALGVDAIELHTGEYANTRGAERAEQLERLRRAAALGRGLGLGVHAGHGLTYQNVAPVAAVPEIEELNIGHSIVSHAAFVGLERAVREMRELVLQRTPIGLMPQRLSDYLAAEASEYLDQLDGLLSAPEPPDLEEVARLARGILGSAQLAGAAPLVRVAEPLEAAALAALAGSPPWSEALRQRAAQAVADLRQLIGALHQWGPREEARVRESVARWGQAVAAPAAPSAAPAAPPADDAVPIDALFFDDAGPHVLSGPEAVPVESLLVRGEEALRRALELRAELERQVEGGAARELLDEVFDLVALGLPEGSARA